MRTANCSVSSGRYFEIFGDYAGFAGEIANTTGHLPAVLSGTAGGLLEGVMNTMEDADGRSQISDRTPPGGIDTYCRKSETGGNAAGDSSAMPD